MFDYHPSFERMLQSFGDSLNANGSRLCAFKVRSVATSENGIWKNVFTVGLGLSKLPEAGHQSLVYNYDNVCLIEESLSPEHVIPFVRAVGAGSAIVGGCSISFSELVSNWSERRLPSSNEYCKAPARVYESNRQTNLGFPDRPLLHIVNPCFPTLGHAIRSWARLDYFVPQSSSNQGNVILVMPDLRASIQEIVLNENIAKIKIEFLASEPALILRSTWIFNGQAQFATARVENQYVTIDVPADATEAYLWLLNDKGELLDSYHEAGFKPVGTRPLLRRRSLGTDTESILRDRRGGETDAVEFKPYLKLDHDKAEELCETVIAFSNTRGGRIYLGITDQGEITGIEKELIKLLRSGRSSEVRDGPSESLGLSALLSVELEKYTNAILRFLADRITPSPEFDVIRADVGGHVVVVVEVREGKSMPYSRVGKSWGIWVRRGANNMPPDPNTIWSSSIPSGLSFMGN